MQFPSVGDWMRRGREQPSGPSRVLSRSPFMEWIRQGPSGQTSPPAVWSSDRVPVWFQWMLLMKVYLCSRWWPDPTLRRHWRRSPRSHGPLKWPVVWWNLEATPKLVLGCSTDTWPLGGRQNPKLYPSCWKSLQVVTHGEEVWEPVSHKGSLTLFTGKMLWTTAVSCKALITLYYTINALSELITLNEPPLGYCFATSHTR